MIKELSAHFTMYSRLQHFAAVSIWDLGVQITGHDAFGALARVLVAKPAFVPLLPMSFLGGLIASSPMRT